MKSKYWILLGALLVVGGVSADVSTGSDPFKGSVEGEGWSITISDNNIDTTPRMLVEDGGTFTQLTGTGSKINIGRTTTRLFYDNNDTVWVYVAGIDTSRRYVTERLLTHPVGGVTSASTFYALEAAWVDSEMNAQDTMIVFDSSHNRLSVLRDSLIHEAPAQRLFDSRDYPLMTSVQAGMRSSTAWVCEVRVYEDLESTRTPSKGYHVAARLNVVANAPMASYTWPDGGLRLSPESVVQVWGTGASDNASGWVTLTGRRRR